jgi:hypothetical protein
MSKLEAFLARVYVDSAARARFLANPVQEALDAGLPPEDAAALAKIKAVPLELAARSFASKRRSKRHERARTPVISGALHIARCALHSFFSRFSEKFR